MVTARTGPRAPLLATVLVAAGLLAAAPAPAQPARAPVVLLRLGPREGDVKPVRHGGATLTGGGAVVVTQPAPDTIVLNVTGVAAAKGQPCGPSMAAIEANVCQQFEVVFPAGVKPARLTVEARISGLLRSEGHKGGSAELAEASAAVQSGAETLVSLALPSRGVHGDDALAVSLVDGPTCVPVGPGCYSLHAGLRLVAEQGKSLLPWIASAEFAPPPALPPRWIHDPDPFGGLDRSGLGFQVIVKVEPEPAPPAKPAQP